MSAAFAGPLLGIVDGEGGGLHFFGNSSIGKTTMCMKATASVWGAPNFVRSCRSTANGLEALAAAATDTLLPLDELGVADAHDIAAGVYQLCRQRREESRKVERRTEWCAVMARHCALDRRTTHCGKVGRSRRQSASRAIGSAARPSCRWRVAATLDGRVEGNGAVFEAKFMLPWSFSEEAAAEKYMPQLQHNMWVVAARSAVLSVITGGGKWVEITAHADPLYQHLIVTAERKFWRCVESGEPPRLFGVEPPKPRIEAIRIVDMSASNAWAEFAAVFSRTRSAYLEHEQAKAELKGLMPEDAKEAIGHGIRAKRSKSGALMSVEGGRA
jgi:Domain of unknown function (DUF927)